MSIDKRTFTQVPAILQFINALLLGVLVLKMRVWACLVLVKSCWHQMEELQIMHRLLELLELLHFGTSRCVILTSHWWLAFFLCTAGESRGSASWPVVASVPRPAGIHQL
jgi:hypothetical protein